MKHINVSNRILAVDDQVEIRNHYEATFSNAKPRLAQAIDNLFANALEASASVAAIETPPYKEYFLSSAHLGQVAVDMVQQSVDNNQPFKVAFIDIRMPPGMDGLATAEQIRLIDPRIFIVFVTAHSDYNSNILDAKMGQSTLLLNKPFGQEELLQLANNCCRRWDTEQSMAANITKTNSTVAELSNSAALASITAALAPIDQHLNNLKTAELAASVLYNDVNPIKSKTEHDQDRTTLLLTQVLKNNSH